MERKVVIVASKSRYRDEQSIIHLVGREFTVVDEDESGVYIPYGPSGNYFIYNDEFEEASNT